MNFFNYMLITHRDHLISPAMNFGGYGTVALNFRHAYEQRVRIDSLIIRVSQDCGATWDRVWAMGPNGTPNVFVTHPSTNAAFYPQSANDWCGGSYGVGCYTIDLTSYAGKPDIKLMFESFAFFGNNLFLNDINVSGTVGVPEHGKTGSGFTIYPNPTTGQFVLTFTGKKGEAVMDVLNPQGQVVRTDRFTTIPGKNEWHLDFAGFSKGVYFIRVTDAFSSQVQKIVIE